MARLEMIGWLPDITKSDLKAFITKWDTIIGKIFNIKENEKDGIEILVEENIRIKMQDERWKIIPSSCG